mgnify:CR=1 FL=1
MNISEFPFQEYVGNILKHDKEYGGTKYVMHKRKLKLEFDKEIVKSKLAICYMIVVNDKIKKIGQTAGEGGLYSCMGFYGGAGMDDPSITRFGINLLMRKEMEKGNDVEIYFQYDKPHKHTFMGATGSVTKEILMDAGEIEKDCLSHYVDATEKYPEWNFQEDGDKKSMPTWIKESYAAYIGKRKGKK